jgi:hypothetical protein
MAVWMNVIRRPLHAIDLTAFAKNDGGTDNFCSVCFRGEIVFSLFESMDMFVLSDYYLIDSYFFCWGKNSLR